MIPSDVVNALDRIANGQRPASIESFTIEFKEQPRREQEAYEMLVETAICFANASGGTIVVGIDDDVSGPAAFTGCTLEPAAVQSRIYEITRPSLLVGARQYVHSGVELLVIAVPESVDIHGDSRGRATRRFGTSCRSLSPDEQARLREERRGVDWSAQPSGRSTAEVVPGALETARRLLRSADDERRRLADSSDTELLRALGVIDDRDRLLRAGSILFCEPPPRSQPAVVYQYRPSPSAEALSVERLSGPLVHTLDRLLAVIAARRNVTPLNLPGGAQIELADFPDGAVREAVTNALLHREYRLDESVAVEHSPLSLVVSSPGPLVGGVTPENILTHPSRPRNRCLFSAARTLRLSEETGRGVDRMYREMLRSGRDVPAIEEQPTLVRVALVGGAPRTQIARYIAQLPDPERDDVDTLLVLLTLCGRRTITAAELAPIIQKQVAEAAAVLDRLAQDPLGLLEPTRRTRHYVRPEYRLRADVLRSLGSAVRYRRRTVDEIDRKVIAHVHEYGRITNRTLQNLLDVDVYRARDILRDLTGRELLVRTSIQTRGPSVEYGPGPAFPERPARRGVSRTRRADGNQLNLDDAESG